MKSLKKHLREGPGAGYKVTLKFNSGRIISQQSFISQKVFNVDMDLKGTIDAEWEGYDWGGSEDDIKSEFSYKIEIDLAKIRAWHFFEYFAYIFDDIGLKKDVNFFNYVVSLTGDTDADISDMLEILEYYIEKHGWKLWDLYMFLEGFNKKIAFTVFDMFVNQLLKDSSLYTECTFIYSAGYTHSDLPEEFYVPMDDDYCIIDGMEISHIVSDIYVRSPALADLVNTSYDDEYDEDEDY
jgi:hypothetical protein